MSCIIVLGVIYGGKSLFLVIVCYRYTFSMVCSLGSGRMAVMAKLLAAKSFSQSKAGRIEVGHQKLAAKLICKELNEADEANLLDEEGNLLSFFSF